MLSLLSNPCLAKLFAQEFSSLKLLENNERPLENKKVNIFSISHEDAKGQYFPHGKA